MISIKLPFDVAHILNTLENAGYEAYVVGGCVRDSLIGAEPNDWDICTNALPEQTEEVFKDYQIIETGLKHGTITVMVNDIGYEITTYRTESQYSDGRHPDKVTFVSSLEEDLKRRDFTINAMAYSPDRGLVDLFGGMADLLINHVIKCVGDPYERFAEDSLRELRAFRFLVKLASQTNCSSWYIDEKTYDAIYDDKRKLHNISKERINAELTKIFSTKNFLRAGSVFIDVSNLLMDSSVFTAPKDSLYMCHEANLEEVQDIFNNIQPNSDEQLYYERLYLFFIHFLPRMGSQEKSLKELLLDLKFDNQTIKTLTDIEKCSNYYMSVSKKDIPDFEHVIARWLLRDYSSDVAFMSLDIIMSDMTVKQTGYLWGIVNVYNEMRNVLKNGDCYSLKQLAINGSDVMNLGFTGSKVGEILEHALNSHILNQVDNNKEDLTDYIKNIYIKGDN